MTEERRRFGAFSSSIDPQKLSLTFESLAKVLIGIVGWFAASQSLDPAQAQNQLQAIIDLIVQAIPMGFAFWNLLNGIWGATRKLLVFFFPAQ